ncbi:MAG TPA: endonuclease domain-containing protein [Candidatus Aminicenantes bacterium]|nr:endonuclease domain-containing protein [Candidatus Aminicenantes bacterium]
MDHSQRRSPKVIGAVKNGSTYRALHPVAERMRAEPTTAERTLWHELRGKKLGVKFRRQHVIDRFIVDFYCVELGLVVEVDGDVHARQFHRDQERSRLLEALGCVVIRFGNSEVEQSLPGVLVKVRDAIQGLSGEMD